MVLDGDGRRERDRERDGADSGERDIARDRDVSRKGDNNGAGLQTRP